MNPKGKLKKTKDGYEVEGDTDTSNTKYYKEQIEEQESNQEEDELEQAVRTWTKRVNELPEGDEDLKRSEARLEHLRNMIQKKRDLKKL